MRRIYKAPSYSDRDRGAAGPKATGRHIDENMFQTLPLSLSLRIDFIHSDLLYAHAGPMVGDRELIL